eukprot:CAMPEP_0170252788 /NCGR_PEP_ID=MMETSP0116_2-20130129/26231_1 /TAXON_ID=400756 /ORGANISM="Durinskia baltica, Strain CSIRO CS-38" /LENGTH=441 /DNA_ID=CAMNT_0010503765 /DNA_START=9 /DNA_END=1331 /DNA_ORIENTATION=-
MSAELLSALFKRRSDVDKGAQTWESAPQKSSADASHLKGLEFSSNAPSAQEWLQQLDITPEEDHLAEALADGLSERRESLPSHVPAISAKDAERLQMLTEAVAKMQREFAAEREGLAASREELERREAEVRSREQALQAEREEQRRRKEESVNYPQPAWLENLEGTINIGVVGNSGVGKSLLINKLRRVRPGGVGWAPVGVNETTREPTKYPFPGHPKVCLWDLPGAGTAAVPSDTYVQDMGLRYFDKVLILTAGRFTSMEVTLRAELERHSVPFFMVRTKVDIDVYNNHEDNQRDQETTLREIRQDLRSNHGVTDAYLISSRDVESYDMPRLMQDLFPGLKRQLDAAAPTFCPGAPAWNDAWAMPDALSPVLSALQGRWTDAFRAVYLVQGQQVHVTLANGQRAVVPLTQAPGQIFWCSRWFISDDSITKARRSAELCWV